MVAYESTIRACTAYALQIPSIVAASNRLSVTIKLASDTLLLEYRV